MTDQLKRITFLLFLAFVMALPTAVITYAQSCGDIFNNYGLVTYEQAFSGLCSNQSATCYYDECYSDVCDFGFAWNCLFWAPGQNACTPASEELCEPDSWSKLMGPRWDPRKALVGLLHPGEQAE